MVIHSLALCTYVQMHTLIVYYTALHQIEYILCLHIQHWILHVVMSIWSITLLVQETC